MASGRRSSGGRRGRGGSPGCLLVLAALVVILFLFLLNLGKIRQTIGSTNFQDIVGTQHGTGAPPAAPSVPALSPTAASPTAASPTAPSGSAPSGAASPAAGGATAPAAPGGGAVTQAPQPQTTPTPAPQPAGRPGASGSSGGAPATPGAGASSLPQGGVRNSQQGSGIAATRTRPTALYFIRIENDGVIVRQEVKRNLAVSDSPLTDALESLLEGPTTEELREHLMTLVPLGTKLLGVEVHGSTAYVNFNEAFMYNHYGIEGYAGQLKQIVYTATSFPTVQDVQILI
ncbi:MAG TPA: GerMN domain-containing protein, partial [Rectinemataceae bacterium]|nr:GerMN domain-containing protein [Rectinemataceae bacterium]